MEYRADRRRTNVYVLAAALPSVRIQYGYCLLAALGIQAPEQQKIIEKTSVRTRNLHSVANISMASLVVSWQFFAIPMRRRISGSLFPFFLMSDSKFKNLSTFRI